MRQDSPTLLAMMAALDRDPTISTYAELARASGCSYRAVSHVAWNLRIKKRITRSQIGIVILGSTEHVRCGITKLTEEEIASAGRQAGPFQKRITRPDGWLRAIILGEADKMLEGAPPDDRELAKQIIESKGSTNTTQEPVKYRNRKGEVVVARRHRQRHNTQGEPLLDAPLAPPMLTSAHQRALQERLVLEQLLAEAEHEVLLRRKRLGPKVSEAASKRFCHVCCGLAHRRPRKGKCSCGERWKAEEIEVVIERSSPLASFDD